MTVHVGERPHDLEGILDRTQRLIDETVGEEEPTHTFRRSPVPSGEEYEIRVGQYQDSLFKLQKITTSPVIDTTNSYQVMGSRGKVKNETFLGFTELEGGGPAEIEDGWKLDTYNKDVRRTTDPLVFMWENQFVADDRTVTKRIDDYWEEQQANAQKATP